METNLDAILRAALTSAIRNSVSLASVTALYQEIKSGRKSSQALELEIPSDFLPSLEFLPRAMAVYLGSGYSAGQIASILDRNTSTVSKTIATQVRPLLGYTSHSQLAVILRQSSVPYAPLEFAPFTEINSRLNDTERMLIEACTSGQSNDQLADFFGLSRKGMNGRMATIFRKVGVHTRVALVRWWIENGGAYEPFVPATELAHA